MKYARVQTDRQTCLSQCSVFPYGGEGGEVISPARKNQTRSQLGGVEQLKALAVWGC